MAIECPHCRSSISIKNAKPGQYAPKCPKCSKKFFLIVPDDDDDAWIVADSLEAARLSQALAPDPDATELEPPPASAVTTKKIRVTKTAAFEEIDASDFAQPLTEKTAAADTERLPAIPDSLGAEDVPGDKS